MQLLLTVRMILLLAWECVSFRTPVGLNRCVREGFSHHFTCFEFWPHVAFIQHWHAERVNRYLPVPYRDGERERSVSLHACIIVAISLNHAEIIVGFNSFFTIWAFVLGFRICLCCPARITISLAMILTEATGTGIFGLPIFMVVVIATWVGPASLNCQVSPCKFKAQIERPTSKIKKLFNNREHEGGRGPGLKRISWWWEMMKTWCLSLSLPATVESGRRPGHELCKPC